MGGLSGVRKITVANLLVKEISKELLAEVNYAASMAGKTQREWVIKVLTEATGMKASGRGVDGARARHGAGGRRESGSTPGLPPTSPAKDASSFSETIPGQKCWCGAGLVELLNETTRTKKWKCLGKPSHIMSPKTGETK